MNLKFWKRQPHIPIETQTELIDLRAKVAEYAEKIVLLQEQKRLFLEAWRLQLRTMRHTLCPACGCDVDAWKEVFQEEHKCEVKS